MGASTTVQYLPFTPVLDTNIYADNDVMFNSIEITNAFFAKGRSLELVSVQGHDTDDQGVDFDIVFSQAALTLGTINAAVSVTDADLQTAGVLGFMSILGASGHYCDLINGQLISARLSEPLILEAGANSRSLFVSGIIRSGTPTFTASGVKLALGVRLH